jgi:hypothetical protein
MLRANSSLLKLAIDPPLDIFEIVAITYDYGFGVDDFNDNKSATRVKVVSLDWLYKPT